MAPQSQQPSPATKSDGALSPLAYPVFRAVWIATVVSSVGTWMQDIGNAWPMTSLSTSPLRVSLVLAGRTLPMFLLALPAHALARGREAMTHPFSSTAGRRLCRRIDLAAGSREEVPMRIG